MTRKVIFAVASLGLVCFFCTDQTPIGGKSATLVARNSTRSDIPPTETSSHLPPLAQSVISATLGRDVPLYRVRGEGRGFRAENVRHRLAARFTSRRVEVERGNTRWAMAVSSLGRGHAMRSIDRVAPNASFNRVEYQYSGLTEWYVNGPAGLEQGFTVEGASGKSAAEPMTIALA